MSDLGERVASSKRTAWVFVVIASASLVALAVWAWIARTAPELDPWASGALYVTIGLCTFTLVAGVMATHLVGRPMALRTGYPGEWVFGQTWLGLLLIVLIPLIGSFVGLLFALVQLRGRLQDSDGFTTSQEERTRFGIRYPGVTFRHGESKPAGTLMLCLSLTWPVALLGLINPYNFAP